MSLWTVIKMKKVNNFPINILFNLRLSYIKIKLTKWYPELTFERNTFLISYGIKLVKCILGEE